MTPPRPRRHSRARLARATTRAALLSLATLTPSLHAQGAAQPSSLAFRCAPSTTAAAVGLTGQTLFTAERGHGFRDSLDGDAAGVCASSRPFLFDVALPEGNYQVTIELGHPARATETTVKVEARRLVLERVRTRPGQFETRTFTVNVRTAAIPGGDSVRLKSREVGSATWDDRLTLELNGTNPSLRAIRIEPVRRRPITVFLAGNSTVVDQTAEPWAAWGQMFPRFFRPGRVVIANHAESGESLKSFVAERRLDKIMGTMSRGDYLFIEFAHNDQKPGGSYVEPFTTYKEQLRLYIEKARSRGATPVLVTSMHRRRFDSTGAIVNTLGDYPEAVRQTAREEQVALIDLNAMSKRFYEALGPNESKKAFVHYPAGTYPNQTTDLADDTHFNNYGAYELARMVVEGLRRTSLPLARELAPDAGRFDPSKPDPVDRFALPASPVTVTVKPAGS